MNLKIGTTRRWMDSLESAATVCSDGDPVHDAVANDLLEVKEALLKARLDVLARRFIFHKDHYIRLSSFVAEVPLTLAFDGLPLVDGEAFVTRVEIVNPHKFATFVFEQREPSDYGGKEGIELYEQVAIDKAKRIIDLGLVTQ